ncbi:bromodomain-containing protein DDB_G0280777 [Zerene cesonia]|uniref:bromodomain-containing protein DDB_G0280777 n=1 Tax=Zerene cesonia TaxID=33412 RepID=UPI0018E551CD|nr:bromodomain-containing protein DDB_G0280777 [Zerene cesonia]
MRLVLLLSIVLACAAAQESFTTDTINDKLNNVEPNPSVRLDPYIRKALLKALSELEESTNVNEAETTDSTSSSSAETLSTNQHVGQPQINENIQIHSFVVNGQEAFKNNSNTAPTLLDNKISILSTTVGNVENYVTATLPTQTPFKEIFQAKETGVNLQQIRSISNTPKSNFISDQFNKFTTAKPRLISTTSTTTTTTTTTPKPTHDEDGVNIEEVDKRDVQVYQAPLVAAFTVHQDAHGIPKKVIPIYQQTNTNNQELVKGVSNIISPQGSNDTPKFSSSDYISHQLTLQKQLEEKQRILEEQLRLLQIQQRQQEELLRKQHFLLQQKEAQREQLLFLEQEQLKRQRNEQQNGSQNNIQQAPLINNVGLNSQGSQITIQPSVSLDQNQNLLANQQLPNREAVDFLIHLRNQQPEQFPLQSNHLPQGITNFLQPSQSQHFVQHQNIQPGKQGNRVFRHESGVGNLGFNNPSYNRFNTFNPIHSNGFFSLSQQNQYNSDNELKQLLFQTGLNGRAHEDLNIVTKVLSLNHGVPINNSVSNRLVFDSRRHVRPS